MKRRSNQQKHRDSERSSDQVRKNVQQELETIFSPIPDRRRERLVAFLETRTLGEKRMILEFIAPHILIAIERQSGVIDVFGLSEQEGASIDMNGGMIQILVKRPRVEQTDISGD